MSGTERYTWSRETDRQTDRQTERGREREVKTRQNKTRFLLPGLRPIVRPPAHSQAGLRPILRPPAHYNRSEHSGSSISHGSNDGLKLSFLELKALETKVDHFCSVGTREERNKERNKEREKETARGVGWGGGGGGDWGGGGL